MLLRVPVYAVSLFIFLGTSRELFWPIRPVEPVGWQWQVVRPLLLTAMTPIALAGSAGVSEHGRGQLIFVGLCAIAISVGIFTVLGRTRYQSMKVDLGTRKVAVRGLSRATTVCGTGTIVIASCLGVSLAVR